MTLAIGSPVLDSVASTTATVHVPAATGGTTPYAYQWFRSTITGFSPGGGNIVAGATALSLADSDLIPGTQYFYVCVVTDSAGTPATAQSAQLAVLTQNTSLNQNQFEQSQIPGDHDLKMNVNTWEAIVDSSQATPLVSGQAVQVVDSVGGPPKVIAAPSDSAQVDGFVHYDVKTISYPAGAPLEISGASNCIYLYATGPISRFKQVVLDLSTIGGVKASASGKTIVGYAYDKAVNPGDLIRVIVDCPSFQLAS